MMGPLTTTTSSSIFGGYGPSGPNVDLDIGRLVRYAFEYKILV